MISINEVRNVVLQLLNKNNRGYITPEEFNNYCKMAQLSIFEELFDDYNKNINKQNQEKNQWKYLIGKGMD